MIIIIIIITGFFFFAIPGTLTLHGKLVSLAEEQEQSEPRAGKQR